MRFVLVALLLVAGGALSGCLSNGDGASKEGAPIPEDPLKKVQSGLTPVYGYDTSVVDLQDPNFPRVVQVILPGGRGAEPNIGVTSKGGIFITAFDSTFRSLDGGKSWKLVYEFEAAPGAPADPFSTSDPMLWVDPDTDRVFTNHMFPVLGCSSNIISDDNGETWTHFPMSCGLPVVDHQKIMTAKPRGLPAEPPLYQNLVYYCYNKLVSTNCAVSYDGGIHYQYDRPVATSCAVPTAAGCLPPEECGGINGHPSAAPDGTVYVPFGLNCGQHHVAYTEDNGLTWTINSFGPETGSGFGDSEIDPEVVVTPDGTAYYYSRDRDSGNGSLWRSKDKFATVEGPFRVNPPNVQGVIHAAMASGTNGAVAIAYYGNKDFSGSPSEAPDETRWHLYVSYSFDADKAKPTFQTQQVTPEDDPVQIGCIWLQGGGGGEKACRNLLDFIDGVVDKDGRFHVTFTDGCTDRTNCAGNPKAEWQDSRDRAVSLAIQDHGPSLLEPTKLLPSIGYTSQVMDHNKKA